MTPPEAPTAPPPEGRHWRPGEAGSAVARVLVISFVWWSL